MILWCNIGDTYVGIALSWDGLKDGCICSLVGVACCGEGEE